MRIKGLIDEDFLQYKEPSMFIIFPYCTFKCDLENGTQICQNWSLAKAPTIEIKVEDLIERYLNNKITKSIVMGGLEPLDSTLDVLTFISLLRNKYNCDDTVVIYTGYKEDEIVETINKLKMFNNIIVKFGRFIPGQDSHKDSILGIDLASNNQYAVKIS